jgi:pimeloyl-ACP methyl ester carboxylesterase
MIELTRRFLVLIHALLLAGAVGGQVLAAPVERQPASAPPLWGDLAAGPYRVGFRTIFQFDASRTWRRTRDYTGKFSADPGGRPIQLNVWYPSTDESRQKQMAFVDYVDQTAPSDFSVLNSTMRERNRQNAKNSVTPAQLSALLSTPMYAQANAQAVQGRFPTVLYFGGLNADINANVVLAEFLASHGYVVACISLLGPSDQQLSQSNSPSDLEAIVRDMESVLPTLRDVAHADPARLAVMGHSLGGVESAQLGIRNGNVSAIISLDGTYGFRGSAGVLTNSYGYAPEKVRAAFLDLRRAQGEQGADLDLTPILSFRCADRVLVTLTKMHHSDFTSFAMVAHQFHVATDPIYSGTGWSRETARRGYEITCRIVLDFLDEKTAGRSAPSDKLRQMVAGIEGSTFRHLNAQYAVPTPPEVVAVANKGSLDAVKTLLTSICGDQSVGAGVDADLFNAYGYDLLSRQHFADATVVFEVVAWAHPASANAQDSLADGYLAVGQREKARLAVQRAIELAPADKTMDAESRASFIADEIRRLKQLK